MWVFTGKNLILDVSTLNFAVPLDGTEKDDGKYFITVHYVVEGQPIVYTMIPYNSKLDRDTDFENLAVFVEAWQKTEEKPQEESIPADFDEDDF